MTCKQPRYSCSGWSRCALFRIIIVHSSLYYGTPGSEEYIIVKMSVSLSYAFTVAVQWRSRGGGAKGAFALPFSRNVFFVL